MTMDCKLCANRATPGCGGMCAQCYGEAKLVQGARFIPHQWRRYQMPGETGPAFGVELEVEPPPTSPLLNATALLDKLEATTPGLFLVKRDTSLRNGLELVSHPATLRAHREVVPWEHVLRMVPMSVSARCGLHIHVGRDKLVGLQPSHMQKFIYNNRTFWSILSGRRWASPVVVRYANYGRMGNSYRCSAVNLSGESTVEVRTFAATLEYDLLMARLEAVAVLVDLTKDHAHPPGLVDFLDRARKLGTTKLVRLLKTLGWGDIGVRQGAWRGANEVLLHLADGTVRPHQNLATAGEALTEHSGSSSTSMCAFAVDKRGRVRWVWDPGTRQLVLYTNALAERGCRRV